MPWKRRTHGTPRQIGKPFKTRVRGGKTEYYDPEMKVWKTSIFFEPKHEKYAEIVSFENPREAMQASAILEREFDDAKTRAKKVRVKRVTVLAGNRAEAMLQKKELSTSERREFREIAKIYRDTAKRMVLD